MTRNAKTSSAFTKIAAGLEDAIAYHRGERQLTVRDVELKPAPPTRAKEVRPDLRSGGESGMPATEPDE